MQGCRSMGLFINNMAEHVFSGVLNVLGARACRSHSVFGLLKNGRLFRKLYILIVNITLNSWSIDDGSGDQDASKKYSFEGQLTEQSIKFEIKIVYNMWSVNLNSVGLLRFQMISYKKWYARIFLIMLEHPHYCM